MLTATLRLPALRPLPPMGRHWPATLVLATMIGLYMIAGMSLLGAGELDGRAVARVTGNLPQAVRAHAPPAPEPLQFRAIAPTDAVAINAAVPIAKGPNPAARAFESRANSAADRLRALECLTAAVYYEAAIEPLDGQRAVAQVVLNRVRHPAFPKSVCGVVYQGSERATGCQFTFTCDGSLRRTPSAAGWKRAREVAEAALAGKVYAPVGYATHYHTNWMVPYWSSSLVKAAEVGTHIFYRWTGGWGKPGAFTGRQSGNEPDLARGARLAALSGRPAEGAEGTTDALAAEAADEAHSGSVDSFQRAVLRRYEPATREGVATVLAAQTRNGDAVAASYRWAMTGDGAGQKQAPLGKPAAATPPPPTCTATARPAAEATGAKAEC